MFVTFLIVYISICQFSIAFVEDIEESFRDFGKNAINCNGQFTDAQKTELYQKLCNIIKFHTTVIQLSIFPKIKFTVITENQNIIRIVPKTFQLEIKIQNRPKPFKKFQNFSKISKNFKKFQKVSKKFQKISISFKKFRKISKNFI